MTPEKGAKTPGSPPAPAPALEFELVLIDGDNLLHRVRGMRDEAGLRWLLPRLRAWRPTGVSIQVLLDGHPDPREAYRRRVSSGVEFRHSGDVDADTALVGTLRARPYGERSRTVVVTDDRALGDRVRHEGGMTRRLDWLVAGLASSVGEGVPSAGGSRNATTPTGIGGGKRKPANPPESAGADDGEDEPTPWKPGRGATVKHGNARRLGKGSRPRHF